MLGGLATSPRTLPWGRRTAVIVVILPLSLWLLASATAAGAQVTTVLVTEVDGIITPVIGDHIREGVARAEEEGHHAFLVELDTPGGLDASMRDIIQTFLGANIPVVVHVTPSGARAASAGALITMSAHIAAMSPGTAIGAATPVDLERGDDVERKIIEDASAYAESVARARGRNAEFAVEAVREGRSVTAERAERIDVVDLLAPNRGALLEAIDGETVTLAIMYEVANPGFGGGAIVGVILILLALFALAILPVNALGGLLLALAAILFVVEIFTPGVGVGAAGGTAALVLGGLFLFRGRVGVDPEVLIPVAVVVGVATALAGRLAWRTRRLAPTTGSGGLLGSIAVVRSASGTRGQAIVDGAWWNVRTKGDQLREGATVRVVDIKGLELFVEEQGATETKQDEERKESEP
jgi:membrane-bound serine protease (ClpP class)